MAEITLGGTSIHTSGEIPLIGVQAPDFTLVKADLSEVALSDLKGKRVVLNVFPSIDTGICAMSARAFNERLANLENVEVLCVSKDLPFALGRFCAAEGLERVMPVSAFRSTDIDTAYGLVITDGPLKGLLSRAVIVIDEAGKIIYTEQVPEIKQEPNYEAAIAVL